jgi:hypothetical protein
MRWISGSPSNTEKKTVPSFGMAMVLAKILRYGSTINDVQRCSTHLEHIACTIFAFVYYIRICRLDTYLCVCLSVVSSLQFCAPLRACSGFMTHGLGLQPLEPRSQLDNNIGIATQHRNVPSLLLIS